MDKSSDSGGWISGRWKSILTIFTFSVLALLIYTLRRQIVDVISNLGQVNTWALLLMVPLQILNYDAYARLYRSFFNILKERVSYRSMYRLSLEMMFVNHVLPSGGVSGISYFGLRMRSFGVNAAKATLVQLMKFMLIFVSFQILLVAGLFALAVKGHVNNFTILISASVITLVVVGTLTGAYILESRSRIRGFLTLLTKVLNKLIQVIRPRYPETINLQKAQNTFEDLHENYIILKSNWPALKGPLLYALIANITEVATVYVVYIAFGNFVNVGAVILAYAVANFAGLISVLPGGVGVYETLMTAVLISAGIKPELAIPVVIMYRILSMFIQLVPGYVLYHRAMNHTSVK